MRAAGRIAGALVAIVLACGTAMAGDYAQREILGFSPDGHTFAFEEYGVQDGSGFPYSNIYVVDTSDDSWVAGTPIRVRRDDETVPLATVRADARKQSSALLNKYGIVPVGETLVSNPMTEIGADPYVVRFLTNPYVHTDRIWTLTLTPLPFPDPPGCENSGPCRASVSCFAMPMARSRHCRRTPSFPHPAAALRTMPFPTSSSLTPSPPRRPWPSSSPSTPSVSKAWIAAFWR